MSTPARNDAHERTRTSSGRSPRLRAVADPAASALRFSESVRTVVDLARRGGLNAPVFRSPPRLDGVDRTIRRTRHGAVVAVRRVGRPLAAVQADVIEGVVAANGLTGARADRFRRVAWQRLERVGAPSTPAPRRLTEAARRAPQGRSGNGRAIPGRAAHDRTAEDRVA